MALAALLVGLTLPLLAGASIAPAAVSADVAAEVHDQPDVALDRLAPIVTAPAVRAATALTPAAVLVAVLPALLLAALAWPTGALRRPVLWTLVRPDRVTAARRGSPSTAWRAPPTVR